MVSSEPNFIMLVQNFKGPPRKDFSIQKHAKFGVTLDDFDVRWWISPEQMKILKIEWYTHLSSGHVTLLPREYQPLKCSSQSDLGLWTDSRWALPQISSLLLLDLKAAYNVCSTFYTRKQLCFQRVLAIAILSVCLSHGWIRQKQSKLGSPNLHHRLPGRL